MSKRRPPSKRARQTEKAQAVGSDSGDGKGRDKATDGPPARKPLFSSAALRETVESVVVAFVLAFLFRTFEAEAFVIPTGSMAPTLMGRHKDLECPLCHYHFQVSASEEVHPITNALTGDWVEEGTCPMCRRPFHLGDAEPRPDRYPPFWDEYPSYKGDRILVGKFCYQFSDPERWDVAVFKYPGGAQTNYIKRLVGLPEELVWIWHGDIFTGALPDEAGMRELEALSQPAEVLQFLQQRTLIRRKPPRKLLAMLQPVYDNDYAVPELIERGWPARWQAWPSADGSTQGAWTSDDDRTFGTDGSAAGEAWLRYQHVVPRQWEEKTDGKWVPVDFPPQRQLIADFCAYNAGRSVGKSYPDSDSAGLHWVGDLALQCTLEVLPAAADQAVSGEAVVELVEGGWRMQCRIDVATGEATLKIDHGDLQGQAARTEDGQEYAPTATTAVCGPGKHEIIFSNCDDELRLWVDGELVQFDTTTSYAPLDNRRPIDGSFASDLFPVGIGSRGAGLRIDHLKVLRDIYYIAYRVADRNSPSRGTIVMDYQRFPPEDLLRNPSEWHEFDKLPPGVWFLLQQDQFLALGDNSAKSKDGRLWPVDGDEYYVRRELLVGKALFIYWPHSWDKVTIFGKDIPFPFFPNFARMHYVR